MIKYRFSVDGIVETPKGLSNIECKKILYKLVKYKHTITEVSINEADEMDLMDLKRMRKRDAKVVR